MKLKEKILLETITIFFKEEKFNTFLYNKIRNAENNNLTIWLH
jgi:hypothetical protein